MTGKRIPSAGWLSKVPLLYTVWNIELDSFLAHSFHFHKPDPVTLELWIRSPQEEAVPLRITGETCPHRMVRKHLELRPIER